MSQLTTSINSLYTEMIETRASYLEELDTLVDYLRYVVQRAKNEDIQVMLTDLLDSASYDASVDVVVEQINRGILDVDYGCIAPDAIIKRAINGVYTVYYTIPDLNQNFKLEIELNVDHTIESIRLF